MKILRFTKLEKDTLQDYMCRSVSPPALDEDIQYILNELGSERKYWLFGFTENQFDKAKKWISQYKGIVWSKETLLHTLEVDEKDCFIFSDQVVFDSRKAIEISRVNQ